MSADRITAIAAVILLVATIALVTYVRLRLADVPLERDEGEYAYAGQLILEGIPPYELAYNMKFPGTYYAYAALMAVFGQTAWGIRAGLLGVHLATLALVFVLGRRLSGTLGGAAAACLFGLLALDRWSMGVFAHATHFVMLPVMAGLIALHRALDSGRDRSFVLTGVFMGAAIVMKQHAAAFALMAVGLAMWSARHGSMTGILRRGALVAGGAVIPLVILVVVLGLAGVLRPFWFWTFQYAASYVSQTPVSAADDMLGLAWWYITQANAWLWYAGIAGLVLLFVRRSWAASRLLLVGSVLAAGLSIVPGFYFRPHYFIVLMPFAGLLGGVAFVSLDRLLAKIAGATVARVAVIVLFTAFAGMYVSRDAHYLFTMGSRELIRAVYETNPFLESPEIGRYLKTHTSPDDRIVVLGSEPQIFFYAERKSATGYIYTYPLTEAQPYAARMRDEMKMEVEAARPKFLVFVGVPMSWGAQRAGETGLFTWANEFTARCYEPAGIADIDPAGDARIRWDADIKGYQARFPSQVLTFRRTAASGCTTP